MDEDLKQLLEDNKKISEETLAISKEIRDMAKYIKRYIIWSQIFGVIKLFVIIIPIVLGLIYLPPIIGGFYQQYMDLLQNPLSGSVKTPELNLDSLPSSVRGLIEKR